MENTIWIFSCRIKFKTEIKESSKVVPKQNIFISDFDFCLESWELFLRMKTFKKFKSPSSILVTAAPILNCFDIHIIIVFITLNEINSDERVQGGQKGRWKDNDPRETEQHLYERRAIKSFWKNTFQSMTQSLQCQQLQVKATQATKCFSIQPYKIVTMPVMKTRVSLKSSFSNEDCFFIVCELYFKSFNIFNC